MPQQMTYKTPTKTDTVQNVKETTNNMTNAQPMAQNAKNGEMEPLGQCLQIEGK